MNLQRLRQIQPYLWTLPLQPGEKRGEVLLYGSASLLESMDDKVLEQIAHVAALPGLVGAAMTMPDAHWDMLPDRRGGGIRRGAGGCHFRWRCRFRYFLRYPQSTQQPAFAGCDAQACHTGRQVVSNHSGWRG